CQQRRWRHAGHRPGTGVNGREFADEEFVGSKGEEINGVVNRTWQVRSPHRLPDLLWNAAVFRIRAELEVMPSPRRTCEEARRPCGRADPDAAWVLRHLANEGFRIENSRGEYVRRAANP